MGFVRDLKGKRAARAAVKAGEEQAAGAREASALFDPFQQIGQQGIAQAGFLTDPQAQFDFLQNNPLFQSALDNANRQTSQLAAARGRLSAGDTMQQLSQNTLLAASPLIQQQKQSIGNLLNIGQNVAGNQANLRTGESAALAGGLVGAANARSQGMSNLLNLGGQIAGAASGFMGSSPAAAPTAAPQFNHSFDTSFTDSLGG